MRGLMCPFINSVVLLSDAGTTTLHPDVPWWRKNSTAYRNIRVF